MIAKVEIENVRGIARLPLEPRRFTVLLGENSSGKSSVIDAIRSVFEGGYNPKLVRVGEKRAVITITLTDGTTITRTINAERRSSELTIKSADGEVIPSPKKYVEQLASSFAYDPLAFLSASAKDRAKYIERFLAVPVAAAELQGAVNDSWWLEHFVPAESAFANIDRIYTAGFQRRAEINRKKRDLDGAVATIRAGAPTLNEEGVDWAAAERETSERYTAAREAYSVAVEQQNEAGKAALARSREVYDREVERKTAERGRLDVATENWYKAELAKLQAEQSRRLKESAGDLNGALAEAAAAHAEAKLGIARECAKMLAEVVAVEGETLHGAEAARDRARADLDAYNRAVGAREEVLKLEDQVRQLGGQSMALDGVLERLKELRAKKQELIPIPGLELRDGEVWFGGIHFDGLNQGKRFALAISVGMQQPGEFMLCDQAEALDPEAWEEFKRACIESGRQFIVARVSEGVLRVEEAP